jgi:hypothetical protein
MLSLPAFKKKTFGARRAGARRLARRVSPGVAIAAAHAKDAPVKDERMEDESGPAADSQLPYDSWMEESLRHVVIRALQYAAEQGLPGAHHFYITFRTDFPGVQIPSRLTQKYPQEMTIVLQHQFRDLVVDKEARRFGVTLQFGGVSAALSIPLEAVSAFVDPSIQYGLRFRVTMPEPVAQAPEPAAPTVVEKIGREKAAAENPAEADAKPQVVSLDAFRKRRD